MAKVEDYIWDYLNPYQYLNKTRRGLASLPPVIISNAITGSVHGKGANPNLPESPEEQIEQTYESYKAGASIVHIHARDPENPSAGSMKAERYLIINAGIREKCPDIIINNTTAAGMGSIEERCDAVMHAKPEIASLDPHAFIMRMEVGGQSFDACLPITYKDTEDMARIMKENGVKPELELYEPGEFWMVDNLIRQGLVDPPYWVQMVMGFQTAVYATPMNLLTMIQQLPPQSLFSCIGVGVTMVPMIAMGLMLGGHIRVGLEDNVYIEAGKLAKSNAELVEKAVRLAKEMGRPIATPKEARQMLGISEKPTQYK